MINEVIEKNDFFHHYQPIFDIQNWKIYGFEGLFRSEMCSNPETAFSLAKKKKKLYELDSRSIHKASQTYINAGYMERYRKLFVNVFPSTLIHPIFHTFINKIINDNKIPSQQIILEINESETTDYNKLTDSIKVLKNIGILIAIDDFGKGSSSIQSIFEFEPNYIKLDKFFVKGLKDSEHKKEFIRHLLEYSRNFDAKLIVEGVEDEISLAVLKCLGVQYAQGYQLGRPALILNEGE